MIINLFKTLLFIWYICIMYLKTNILFKLLIILNLIIFYLMKNIFNLSNLSSISSQNNTISFRHSVFLPTQFSIQVHPRGSLRSCGRKDYSDSKEGRISRVKDYGKVREESELLLKKKRSWRWDFERLCYFISPSITWLYHICLFSPAT